MKNRTELAQYFAKLGFTKGVEVGLCSGRYSRILYENIPGLQMMGIDPYSYYKNGSVMRTRNANDGNLQKARDVLAEFPNFVLVIGFAHDVSKYVADESLDFVFIDGDHTYESVKQDITDWTPKVRKGGIVSGHDYYVSKSGKLGVIKAVDEYATENGHKVNTTEWDMEAYRDDRQPDFWFVKS